MALPKVFTAWQIVFVTRTNFKIMSIGVEWKFIHLLSGANIQLVFIVVVKLFSYPLRRWSYYLSEYFAVKFESYGKYDFGDLVIGF